MRFRKEHNRLSRILPVLAAVLFSLTSLSCDNLSVKKTYSAENLTQSLTELCKKEYGIDIITSLTGNTIWVYYPVDKMLDDNNQLDETIHKKLGNIYLCLERVILSTAKDIDFFVIDISDTTVGIDFLTIGYLLDMKKFLVSSVSRNDYLNRMIRKVNYNPAAVGDKDGAHLNKFDIKFNDFLTNLIADRIQNILRSRKEITLNYINSTFEDGIISLPYDITGAEDMDLGQELARIILGVLQGYTLGDFTALELHDMRSDKKTVYTKIDINRLKPLLPSSPQS